MTAANIVMLYLRMAVNDHDAAVVITLLCYILAAGLAVALVIARGTTGAVGHLADTARALGEGDLDARVLPELPGSVWRRAGLGLTLAKRIVEALGGRISAESPPAQGAVELPLWAGASVDVADA